MYYKCCITNCESKREDSHLHKFPSSEDQRNKWLDVINYDHLKRMDTDKLVKLLVCHKHFEKRFHTTKSGIKHTAYPTLFSAEEIKTGIPTKSHDDKENKPFDHTYTRKRHNDHTYCKTPKIQEPQTVMREDLEELNDLTPMPLSYTHEDMSDVDSWETAADTVAASTSTCKASNQEASTMGKLMLIPKKLGNNKLLKKIGKLKQKCKILRKEFKKSRRQLNYNIKAKKALALSKKHCLEEITKKMNPLAKQIFDMQVKMCSKNKKGRRFTFEEKLIALSIFKESPKTYEILQKIFILPSKTTLKKMIAGSAINADDTVQISGALNIIYDPRHLINGIRKNLIKDIYMMDGQISKWQGIVDVYETDCKHSQSKLLHKLNEHVIPEKVKKIKLNMLMGDRSPTHKKYIRNGVIS